ncbi:MAG: alpha/beta hydrolase [Pyrinomonadaceae bacterium]
MKKYLLFFFLALPALVFAQTSVKQTNVTGDVYRYDNFPSKITDARNIDVWLPPGYDENKSEKYPVIYMHDGQNLFDPKISQSKIDWGIDKTLERLIKEKKIKAAIVVGIWNTPRRTIEFMPQRAFEVRDNIKRKDENIDIKSAESDKYLKFLVSELKPFIDMAYRTKTDRKNTFIMGSSMGALMSLYAVGEYPDVFGGAGCLSPQYPLGKGVILEYMKKYLPSPKKHKIYFDYGTEGLDADYEPYQKQADDLMRKKGYKQGGNWITRKFVGDDHSEKSWGKRVDIPITFFLGK